MASRWERTAEHDDPELVGAQWWRTALDEDAYGPSRRSALLSLAGLAAAGLTVGGAIGSSGCCVPAGPGSSSAPPEPAAPAETVLDERALVLQQKYGWDVANNGATLAVPPEFVQGAPVAPEVLDGLVERLAPTNPKHAPWYLPVLFQSLVATPTSPDSAPGTALRDLVRPLDGPLVQDSLGRGRGIASLFEGAPPGRAIVVDLPGPEAVAVAAGLADRFDPVFVMDNWPHPLGVVPAHLTLGVLLQMLPEFEAAAAARPNKAMPVFVLDGNRLAPFDETGTRFDNRYLALLPSAEQLAELGITEVMYVRPTAEDVELDDLNADLVAWQEAGIQTQLLNADAFKAPAPGEAPPAPDPNAPAVVPSPDDPYYTTRVHEVHHYYGGAASHWFFWSLFGFGMARFLYSPPLFSAPRFRPRLRPTMFSTSPGFKRAPAGFGHASVRQRAGAAPSLAPRSSTGTFGRGAGGRSGA